MSKKAFMLILCIVAMLSFTACNDKNAVSLNNEAKVRSIALPNQTNDNTLSLSLYFDASNSDKVELVKDERALSKEEVIGELIVQELLKGPSVKIKAYPIFPKDTRLLSFSIQDSIAIVNLSKEAISNMTATKEEACLKSIITSLTQLNSIKKVKLLIDNQSIDTLGGNFNISKALGKDDISNAKISK